jgi:hypothetical protein
MDGIKGKRSIQKYKPDPVPTHGPMELVGNLIKLGKTPAAIRIPGPEFSQHTEEILLVVHHKNIAILPKALESIASHRKDYQA